MRTPVLCLVHWQISCGNSWWPKACQYPIVLSLHRKRYLLFPKKPPSLVPLSLAPLQIPQMLLVLPLPRMVRRKLEYKVKWKGYGTEEDSWEPKANVANAPRLIAEFHWLHPDAPGP